MQTVSAAFTAEERDTVRTVAQNTLVSWKKSYLSTQKFITIGVSTIGGNDIIPGTASTTSAWNRYQYADESGNVIDVAIDKELNLPLGGLVKAMADFTLDNTSGRYLPKYVGGNSELFTSVVPRRPIIINEGFHLNGVDQTIPEFVGVTTKTPEVSLTSKTAVLHAEDFIGYLQNKYLDRQVMFTAQRTDQVIENLLQNLGYGTAQYDLDYGINTIPFGLFDTGTKFADIIDSLVKAEMGHFFQDEEGKLKFWNRQHWDTSPYTQVQRVISTSQVIDAKVPSDDHIINVVEVTSKVRNKKPEQIIYKSVSGGDQMALDASTVTDKFVNFADPVLSMTTPTSSGNISYYKVNTASDGTGTDISSSVTITRVDRFATAAKIFFNNSYPGVGYITDLIITGRPAQYDKDIYVREKRGISVTAYEEQVFAFENDYIQDETWATNLASLVIQDFGLPESIQEISIRAIPELQMGDLISWQRHYWRVYSIKSKMSASAGFVQDLKLVQRTPHIYFKIGISTIGSTDSIAP